MNIVKNNLTKLAGIAMVMTALASCSSDSATNTEAPTQMDPVAAETKTYRGFEIKEDEAEAQAYIMKKQEVAFQDIEGFYGENLPKIFEASGKQKLEMTGSPSGLFFSYDEKAGKTEMAAAVPVAGDQTTVVDGFETFVTPAGKVLVIDYYGAYDKSAEAHYAMDDYMKEKGLTMNGPVVEEYVTDPGTEPDTTKWLTRIYYRVK